VLKYQHALGCAVLAVVLMAGPGIADGPASAPTATTADDCKCGSGTAPQANGVPGLLSAVSSSVTGTEQKAEEKKPEVVEPLFVRPLVQIEPNRNDSNPVWSPRGTLISFERSVGDKKEIRIVLPDGTPVQTVYHVLSNSGKEMKFFFPGISEEISYNAGITWAAAEDRFAFMSNGGEGNYDLYRMDLGNDVALRLTDHKEKDGQAHWSPAANRIVFISGRTGSGDAYLMDVGTRVLTRLTRGGMTHLYPQWSPDGRKIVMMRGSNENHDIVLIADIKQPMESQRALTTWSFDDMRPTWSPDNKKIAFYSNYNAANDPKIWSIFVVAADGSDPTEGDGLAALVVAHDVVPDVETGPAWMPDSNRIIFVKNDRQEYNPLYVADLGKKTAALIKTETKMNHDVACSVEGTIAFRAQVNQWDQIYMMKLKD